MCSKYGINHIPKVIPMEKIKAADIMTRNNAAFFRNTGRQKFDNTTALNVAHYEPLTLSDYALVQERSFKQVKESMLIMP